MLRPLMSYTLTFLVLLSQTGLPLHMHYCKGMLESVSVFFTANWNDHEDLAELPSCCMKSKDKGCSKSSAACCDDEVKVLLQEFDSLLPHFDKWVALSTSADGYVIPLIQQPELAIPRLCLSNDQDSGPLIYILFHSLIYYA